MDPQELKENRPPIRGWLAAFVGFELLALAGHVVGCFAQSKNTGSEQVTAAFFPGIELQLIHTIWIVVIAVGIKRILQHRPGTRIYWIVVLVLSMPLIFYQFVLNIQLSLTQGAVGFADESTALRGNLIRFAFALGWLAYWVRSRRVQRTFSPRDAVPGTGTPSPVG